MPRALTEKEKNEQRQRLLDQGKHVVIGCGVRKVSIDDIAKAAGLAKGTFYQHFESKEQYLFLIIEKLHREAFSKAKQMILEVLAGGGSLRDNARNFLQKLFIMPELAFFIQNEADINMLFKISPNQDLQSFKQMEAGLFEGILRLTGVDTQRIRSGVVHNYIHILFLIKSSNYMAEEDLEETMDLIMDSLIVYIFGGSL